MSITTPTIHNTKLVDAISNNVVSIPYTNLTAPIIRASSNVPQNKTVSDFIDEKYIRNGTKTYVVSGGVKVENNLNSIYIRKYSFVLKAKAGITDQQLKLVVYQKLRSYFDTPRDGSSRNTVLALGVNRLTIPNNFKFRKNARIFKSEPLQMRLFNSLSEETIKRDGNCLVNAVFDCLRTYRTTVTIDEVLHNFQRHSNDDIIKNGCTLDTFSEVMKNDYKYVSYDIIGPNFDVIMSYTAPNRNTDATFTAYVNNKHVYPITDDKVQKYIARSARSRKKTNMRHVFEKFDEFVIPLDFKYMETIDEDIKDGFTYICNKDVDLTDYLIKTVGDTNHSIEYIDMDTNTGRVKKFRHPTKNTYIVEYDDYDERKEQYNILKESVIGLGDFLNKSYGVIGNELIKHLGNIPKSYYNKQSFYYLTEYEVKPVYEIVRKAKKNDVVGVDFYKQYASVFYKDFQEDGFEIPVYDVNHMVREYNQEDITLGEYYIKQVTFKRVSFGGYFVHSHIVSRLLEEKIIKKSDIKYCINTRKTYKPDTFKTFVELCSKLSNTAFKRIVNYMNGTLKDSHFSNANAYFTNDIDSLIYMMLQANEKGLEYKWTTDEKTKYNFLKTFNKTDNLCNTSSIYRATLSCSLLQSMLLVKKIRPYGRIVKVQTDAVYYIPKDYDNLYPIDTPDPDDILGNLGMVTDEEVCYDFEPRYYTAKGLKLFQQSKKNILTTGSAGSGKTYSGVKNSDPKKEILFLSVSNNAILVLQNKAREQKKNMSNWTFKTFAFFFADCQYSYHKMIRKLNTYTTVFVDEVFMTGLVYLRVLLNSDCNIMYTGDPRQLPPIFSESEQPFDFIQSGIFDNCTHIKLKYREDSARFTKDSYYIFNKFIKKGFSNDLKKLPPIDHKKVYDFYIVSTNLKRQEYTTNCCNKFYKKSKKIDFYRKSKKESYRIGNNCPIICNENVKMLREYSIFNNWTGHIVKIGKEEVDIKGAMYKDGEYTVTTMSISRAIFTNNFLPFHCATVHKIQGAHIEGEYAVLELGDKANKMLCNKNMIYTAITRCTDYKNVHIDHEDIKKVFFDVNTSYQYTKYMYPQNKILKNGYIYKYEFKCECHKNKVFIKSTRNKSDDQMMNMRGYKKNCHDNKTTDLIYSGLCTDYVLDKYTNSFIDKYSEPVLKTQRVKIFRELKPTKKNPSNIIITDSKLRFIWYDEKNVRKQKKFECKKKGLSSGLSKMKQYIKDNKLTLDRVNNKTEHKISSDLEIYFD